MRVYNVGATVGMLQSDMPGWTRYTGKIAVLNQHDVDTDRIIPARFLSMVTRSGYGELLFSDVRSAEFPLDQPEAKGASILVAGSNFGCGSSREHAVWAIQQAGFEVVIGKRTESMAGFSDIFRQNAANCALLLIELDAEAFDALAQQGSGAEVTVDLESEVVIAQAMRLPFTLDPALKAQFIKGLDLIGSTLEYAESIDRYESHSKLFVPPRV